MTSFAYYQINFRSRLGRGATMDGSDFTFQVDLIHAVDQMDGDRTDSCAISPTAFLLKLKIAATLQ